MEKEHEHKEHNEQNEQAHEEVVDIKGFSEFFKGRTFKILLPVILILVALFFSVYFRSLPAHMPILDKYAEETIYNNIKGQLADQILKESPNLPPDTVSREVERRFAAEVQASREEIKQATKQLSDNFRQKLEDNSGQPYLSDIDTYEYYREAQNVLKHGYIGDKLVNGSNFDTHMFAPLGAFRSPSLHPYVEAYLYKILEPITGISLMGIVFYVSVIISALAVIPAFFIGRRLSGNLGGFISAFVVAVHQAFISRTAAGIADTDPYNVTFPLYITWVFFMAVESKSMAKRIAYSSIAGVLVGIYSFAWTGWWFVFDFMIAATIAYLAYFVIVNFKEHKHKVFKKEEVINGLTVFCVFVIAAGIVVSLFVGFNSFARAPLQPLNFISLKSVATTTVWPNVYTTVAEQNSVSFPNVVASMGGKLLFYVALIGLLFALAKKKLDKLDYIFIGVSALWYIFVLKLIPDNILFVILVGIPPFAYLVANMIKGEKDVNAFALVLFTIWFMATLYASRQGIRFSLLLVPVFAISIGVLLGIAANKFSEIIANAIHVKKVWAYTTLVVVSLLLMIGPAAAGYKVGYSEVSMMDDAWYDSLINIKDNSQPNAIITSWWDFGHWFKAVADRPVTFDGASQNTPMAHWVGKLLLSENEHVSMGILRMLDCGSNKAFETLDSYIKEPRITIKILNQIIIQDKQAALGSLQKYGLSGEQAESVLKYSHCEQPDAFLITSGDMVGKSGVWAHFGAWDFDKATMYMNVNKLDRQDGVSYLMKEFNMTEDIATKTYYEIQTQEANNWIAPWPSYSQSISCQKSSNTTIDCSGIVIDFANSQVKAPESLPKKLSEIVYLSKAGFSKIVVDPNGEIALAITADGGSAVLMDSALAESLFTRLFYYQGAGLNHFKLVSDKTSLVGERILVWEVDWQGNSSKQAQ